MYPVLCPSHTQAVDMLHPCGSFWLPSVTTGRTSRFSGLHTSETSLDVSRVEVRLLLVRAVFRCSTYLLPLRIMGAATAYCPSRMCQSLYGHHFISSSQERHSYHTDKDTEVRRAEVPCPGRQWCQDLILESFIVCLHSGLLFSVVNGSPGLSHFLSL